MLERIVSSSQADRESVRGRDLKEALFFSVGELARSINTGEFRSTLVAGVRSRLTFPYVLKIAAGVSLANTWELIGRYEIPELIRTFPEKPLDENQGLFVTLFVLRGTLLWFLSSRILDDFREKVWGPGVKAIKEQLFARGDITDP
jgi:hypothetical protein